MSIFTGRKLVTMPISKEEFENDIVGSLQKYLEEAIAIHKTNVKDIKSLHEVYLGKQDILTNKTRYDGSEINNTVVENHSHKIVDFKVGFMYGNPLDYSLLKAQDTDDMTYLNAYLTDANKASLDIEKAQDLYESGLAYQLILPKKSFEIEDIKTDSPFVIKNLPLESTCVVYSSDIPSEELFGLVIGKRKVKNQEKEIYNVFLPKRKIELDDKFNIINDFPQLHNFQPILEYTCNKARMGIIELVVSLQNLLNHINSTQMDDIEQNVNTFMAFYNQRTDDDFLEEYKKFRKERVVVLNTNDPNKPVKVELLKTDLDQSSVNLFYERCIKALYDIASAPQSSGNVTSGGDTGQARLLGNGWESAQNQAQVDQTYLLQYERRLCRNILSICKNFQGCPINNIKPSDIAIKFNINMSNNLLVKAESLKLLNDANMPEKTILNIVGLTNDVDGVGNVWKQNKEEKEQKELQKEVQKQQQAQTNLGISNNEEK